MAHNDHKEAGNAPHPLAAVFQAEIRDASLLLTYGISQGCAVDDDTIRTIKDAEQLLADATFPHADKRTRFEQAYRDLAQAMAPVTARTLRATDDRCGRTAWWLLAVRCPLSEGRLWSRKLWVITALFFVLAYLGEHLSTLINHPNLTVDYESGRTLFGLSLVTLQVLAGIFKGIVPFTYGGIGACAYLLRNAHAFVHKRSFDTNRIPEYYNRILLGVLSGGVIFLFIDPKQLSLEISAAALAFVAGYNSDVLFNTLERISRAILPKLPGEDGAKGTQVTPVSLEKVVEEYAKAGTPEEKKVLEGLINTLKGRL